jgi:hypothetical protein
LWRAGEERREIKCVWLKISHILHILGRDYGESVQESWPATECLYLDFDLLTMGLARERPRGFFVSAIKYNRPQGPRS